MRRATVLLLLVWVSLASHSSAEEIGFVEKFALAAERAEALKQLVPGSEPYYFYHCLHYQNTEQFGKVEPLLKLWVDRHGETSQVREIRHRQALLTYPQSHAASLAYLTRNLGLRFDHTREQQTVVELPSRLDPARISRATLQAEAFRRYSNVQGFEDSGLDGLADEKLTGDRLRHWLQRLKRPDHAGLPELIAADLAAPYSPGFGAYEIHRQLLPEQLKVLLKLRPELIVQTNFVNIWISKLQPSPDVDWRDDPQAYAAYLDRLWDFIEPLAPSFNSLKAHVLYHRLAFDQTQGIFDKERFLAYVVLPKQCSYVDPKYLQLEENRRWIAQLGQNFQAVTLLPPVGDDEPLVRDYLLHFFVKETEWQPYAKYISDLYLKRVLAEAKIVNGLGAAEQWAALLTPAEFQALKERIDLDFSPQNPVRFSADGPVALELSIKNVSSLIVKVYEINALNYYQENGREVDASINLDGLVANEEQIFTYDDPPLRRVRRRFEFPSLDRGGLFVIDFIGNGKSSRAVVRKGKLDYLLENTSTGHLFQVVDEAGKQVKGASLWLAGHEYRANPQGEIRVPFSTQPGLQTIVLQKDQLASLARFQQQSENYALQAAIYVDRESLLAGRLAEVSVRAALKVNQTPVSLELLKKVRLRITSVDIDGVSVSKEVADFQLHENRESIYEFATPHRVVSLQFQLLAQVDLLSREDKVNLSASQAFPLNQINQTDKVEDLFLATIVGKEGQAEHVIDLLGKTGEALADRLVRLTLKPRDFTFTVNATLQTNENGRIELGDLSQIESVTAVSPQGVSETWRLHGDRAVHRNVIQGVAGQTVSTPYMGHAAKPSREQMSLLEVRGNTFVADRFNALRIEKGLLQAVNLPAGDYDLELKRESGAQRIRIRLTAGDKLASYAVGDYRRLEVRGQEPLQIASVTAADEVVRVQLTNFTPFTRVHLFAGRYEPDYDPYLIYGSVRDVGPFSKTFDQAEAVYAEGRDIGDEYRYILERRHAQKFPGNMLQRPSLLLNPWALRTTETGQQQAQGGGNFTAEGGDAATPAERPADIAPPGGDLHGFRTYDFFATSSPVLLNVEPNAEGVIEVKRSALGNRQHLVVVAIDPVSTVVRSLALGDQKPGYLDLRLLKGLPAKEHFTQQKQVTLVKKGDKFRLAEVVSSRMEAYGSLPRVYRLYSTLTNDGKLQEFSFILQWQTLTPEQKKEKYSEYACHELNFFLHEKDPAFFASTVKPYIAQKKDKTFLDDWLTGGDLKPYLQPWNYQQLNTVERILLGRRLPAERAAAQRHVEELFAMLPPDADRYNRLFDTAVQGGALDTQDLFGFADELMDMSKAPMAEESGLANGPGGFTMGGIATNGNAPSAPPAPSDPLGVPAASKQARDGREMDRLSSSMEEARRKKSGDAKGKSDKLAEGELKDLKANAERERSAGYFRQEADERGSYRRLFVKLDTTKEWVENNYYHLPIEQQNAQLATVNAFWVDYAQHQGDGPFLSIHFAEASHNFTEMMFALSVLDLPAEDAEHVTEFADGGMQLTAGGPLLIFHEEILPAQPGDQQTPLLVSQNLFRASDRYRYENNERFDKYVTDEFLTHTVYGCQIVVTNPTSSRRKLDLLMQIPVGALPVSRGKTTRNSQLQLEAFSTAAVEYYFYFPAAGDYAHFPVHLSKDGELIAFAEPVTLHVVNELTNFDRQSWEYVSQYATDAEVLDFLRRENVHRLDLGKIAFRMGKKETFDAVLRLLEKRHAWNDVLWSYSVKHDEPAEIREYLKHVDHFVAQFGLYLDSPLLLIDPVERRTYQHRDYRPLVNARSHQLGRNREILNDRFFEQYQQLLAILSRQPELDDENRLAVVYYLLLQDRIEESLDFFSQVDPERLKTRLQYDYFAAYLDFYTPQTDVAAKISKQYGDYPVDRWRKAFANVDAQLKEAGGAAFQLVDAEDRDQKQAELAASSPGFDFTVEAKKVTLHYQNLDRVQVNYYLMDIELLFSRNPFVQQYSGQFSFIRPNKVDFVELITQDKTVVFDLPAELRNKNVLVEITAGGVTRSQAYYAHSLALQLVENYGQVRVVDAETGKALPKTYVKVYAVYEDDSIHYFKDGYTDLRGRFDYASLSTNELDRVKKFSLLILSETHGAIVREAEPPKR
ncbi:hypothetical protein [Lignipirellula cremea]|uniref:MG2 domain protein n=1 Tax=Lignipirellula cremea TaxID=2528010 RepID=A0A518DV89_9BACT|nr:hypothetical protein [Lignipirellula cremea]QDU95751.1 hypothetical protein Pla8534_35680 [Lignipirellula cremea]